MTATLAPAERLHEYAAQTIEYVRRAVGIALDFDSDTLPLLDHYLRGVPTDQPATLELVVSTAAAYFGEVIVRRLGGRWETAGDAVTDWRVVLPTGVSFSPAGFVAAAILRTEAADLDTSLDAPARMKPYVAQTLERMGPVGEDDFWSLCGRLDTLEHVHEVLVAIAAERLGDVADPDDEGGAGEGDVDDVDAEPEPEADDDDEAPPPHVN